MINTFIIPIIRDDLLERCLETLYKYNKDFYVYVIDQTIDGIDRKLLVNIHLYLRPHRNLGFAKACNEGIKMVETPYFTLLNDDVEFINSKWWDGILKTYDKVKEMTPDKPAILVNPSTIKLPDWSVGRPKGDDFYILPYKKEYTEEEYEWLLTKPHYVNKYLTIQPGSVIDGITMYCSVFYMPYFRKIGLLDEHFYPGSGEDYDWGCRANMIGYRIVGTTLSWIFHHWGSSFKFVDDKKYIIDDKLRWNSNNVKWGEGFDIWGVKCSKCGKNMKIIKGTEFATCDSHPDIRYKIPNNTYIEL